MEAWPARRVAEEATPDHAQGTARSPQARQDQLRAALVHPTGSPCMIVRRSPRCSTGRRLMTSTLKKPLG
eukprot:12892775-Prorocentrum_lima.AAC.1